IPPIKSTVLFICRRILPRDRFVVKHVRQKPTVRRRVLQSFSPTVTFPTILDRQWMSNTPNLLESGPHLGGRIDGQDVPLHFHLRSSAVCIPSCRAGSHSKHNRDRVGPIGRGSGQRQGDGHSNRVGGGAPHAANKRRWIL